MPYPFFSHGVVVDVSTVNQDTSIQQRPFDLRDVCADRVDQLVRRVEIASGRALTGPCERIAAAWRAQTGCCGRSLIEPGTSVPEDASARGHTAHADGVP